MKVWVLYWMVPKTIPNFVRNVRWSLVRSGIIVRKDIRLPVRDIDFSGMEILKWSDPCLNVPQNRCLLLCGLNRKRRLQKRSPNLRDLNSCYNLSIFSGQIRDHRWRIRRNGPNGIKRQSWSSCSNVNSI